MESENLQFKSEDFVHLHLHTDYSLLESAIQLKPLAKTLIDFDMKACAITDYGNMYGVISFYNNLKYAGIKPILGSEFYFTFGSRFEQNASIKAGEKPFYKLILLAQNEKGFENLVYMSSKAFTEGFFNKPRIDAELLSKYGKGLIGLSSGFDGAVWHFLQNEDERRASENAKFFEEILGKNNFYVEIQDHGLESEKKIHKTIVEFSHKNDLPLVATNDVHYLTEEDAKAHEILLCLGEGKTLNDASRRVFNSTKYYLRDASEMWKLFGKELPHALKNTLKIAENCNVELSMEGNLALPDYPIPKSSECSTIDEYFEEVVMQGFEVRHNKTWNKQLEAKTLKYSLDDYKKRIRKEISTIRQMGFPGYFLIVWDFIKYANEKGIPVGPGRGSAAGSLVAYCLEITDVDPLQYDLLFERFLNPERVSMPDIDIDFCVRGRGDVINHVTEVYGRDSVCQIITFGTMASKAAIKDVGRVMQMPLGDVEKIAKLIPPPVRGRNISISQALEQVAELKTLSQKDPKVGDLIDLALRLEGCSRHTSVHAAGVVISPKPLHEIVPVAVSSKNELTSQYTMGDLEKVGMLKMDFLALTTLTIISDCLKSIKQITNTDIDWTSVSLEDEATMRLFGEGRTEAIFQFESSGMQEICRRLKPKELEDLAALNALYRPGPLDGGMVDDFIARHRGEKRVKYIVPEMEEILKNTYGILVYQEQIMQLAQNLAGYTLGEADLMRRAMGKKKREEMVLHQEKFVTGAVERHIEREKAEEIFHLMAQFADYGFNRSHSVAYAYLAFQTAFLKAHFPTFFYSAVLSNESQDSAKIYKYSNEMQIGGLKLLPPDINQSGIGFTPAENSVRFGLSAIKGIGETSVKAIIDARKDGNFTSIFDLTGRLEQGVLNRRGLESLISAGAFDSLKADDDSIRLWRAKLFNSVEKALTHGNRVWSDRVRGQNVLFGVETATDNFTALDLDNVAEWTQAELCNLEKTSVGFYLSVHPLDDFAKILGDLNIRNIADYEDLKAGDMISLAGIVSDFAARHSKKGNLFCMFRLEDQSKSVKCLGWSEFYEKNKDCLKNDQILVIGGKVESNEGQEITFICDEAKALADVVPLKARKMCVEIPYKMTDNNSLSELVDVIGKDQGLCEVELNCVIDERIRLKLRSEPLRIQGTSKLQNRLIELGCRVEWIL